MNWKRILPILWAVLLAGCDQEPPIPQPASKFAAPPGPALFDARFGSKVYPTVQVGGGIWMARNLDYDTLRSVSSWCPGGTDTCPGRGRLYAWWTAMKADSSYSNWCDVWLDSTGICPDGWHLPSVAEWTELSDSLGGSANAGRFLKSPDGWLPALDGSSGGGTQPTGFDAIPAGYRTTGSQGYGWYGHTSPDSAFLAAGNVAAFWTRTNSVPGSCTSAWGYFLESGQPAASLRLVPRVTGLSVRCVKNR